MSSWFIWLYGLPAGIYLLKVNNSRRSGIFIVDFEHISHLVLVFLLLTLRKQMSAGLLNSSDDHLSYH